MTVTAKIHCRATVIDDSGFEAQRVDGDASISDVVGAYGKRETVTLANGFTALSPPTGAQAVVIRAVTGAVTLTLKGVTGDTGVALTTTSLTTIPIVLPLSSPSIGLASSGAATVDVLWL